MESKKGTLKYDVLAGMVVFLVSLPLCLGIASASGTNPFAGVISGIIGGIFVTLISGSKFGVSGPAAGMITIVIVAIESLGFNGFLSAMVIAGVMQFLLGHFKLGFVALFIPNSVIIGMLASIGIVLILKQFPHALGYDAGNVGEFDFKDKGTGASDTNTFTQIIRAFKYSTTGAVIVSIFSFIILMVWKLNALKKYKFFQLIPSALVVVIVGILTNLFYINFYPEYKLESFHLVHLPYELVGGFNALFGGDIPEALTNYSNLFTTPSFSSFFNPSVWSTAVIICLVASIQTLLTVEAGDQIDPEKNITPPNLELKAQGVGNIIAGFVGGIPISQVIVRTSANIDAGAKSKISSFFHGIFLLFIVILFPSIMNLIPLASLAVLLLVIGYNLANPKLFINSWKNGLDQFLPFVITIIAIILSDLLKGIGIGLIAALIAILRSNYSTAYTIKKKDDTYIASFIYLVTFINKGSLAIDLHNIPENSKIIINARKCHYISFDILELLHDFKNIIAKRKNIQVEFEGFERYELT